jgi:hypothetical protein
MRWQLIFARASTLVGLVCHASFEWGGPETLQVTAGVFARREAFPSLLNIWLQPVEHDRGKQTTLSVTGSHAATSLSFFSVVGLSPSDPSWSISNGFAAWRICGRLQIESSFSNCYEAQRQRALLSIRDIPPSVPRPAFQMPSVSQEKQPRHRPNSNSDDQAR